ncbi:MAG TPA: PilZ domain-containing protein [Phycisphaerales bacterium]|nr:PilZ domain-containing protein [Phycisphaerales bacterium]
MAIFPPHQGTSFQHRDAKRRAHKRLPQKSLLANGCEVLDLSESGLRIISSRALKGDLDLTLSAPGIEQTVNARVIWCKKHAFRTFEIGIAFTNCVQTRKVMRWIAHWSARPLSA